jgi:hypothetical protein
MLQNIYLNSSSKTDKDWSFGTKDWSFGTLNCTISESFELGIMWSEAVMDCLEEMSQYLPERTEEN